MITFGCTFAQQARQPQLAALARAGKSNVVLRWAPANPTLWASANASGYRVERVTLSAASNTPTDSGVFAQATLLADSIKPWKANDARWKTLINKNKPAAFLYNSLYATKKQNAGSSNEMAFALLMKSCDLDQELATAHGLIFIDSSAKQNEKYAYRIIAPGPSKKTIVAMLMVNTGEISMPAPPSPLKAVFGDKRAVLTFVTLGNKDYAGYWIERSEDSINYQPVNRVPFIRATTKHDEHKAESTYGDSLPANNKRYYYRVRGITCFGEKGPPGNVVSGMGKPAFTAYPLIDSVQVNSAAATLHFHMPALSGMQVKYFFVQRSDKRSSGYTIISGSLPAQSTLFSDSKPIDAAYYKVSAVNSYGDTAHSFTAYTKLIDETPPAVPALASGLVDSNGIVKLSWPANTDPDLLGYRVYRCNSEKEQPFELTKRILTQPAFTDTISLKTLTREVYYTVRAVDKVYNNSGYSPYCKLLRPDKIAPVAVVFSQVTPTDSCIRLGWHNSSSRDARQYELFRKDANSKWKMIYKWNAADQRISYSDSLLVPETSYQYRVDVIDESANRSSSMTHPVLYKPLFLPPVKPFQFHVDRSKRHIELQWIANNAAVYNFTIYKAKKGETLQVFKDLPGTSSYFIDTQVYPNNAYRYAIKATMKTGSETKLSQVIEVEY